MTYSIFYLQHNGKIIEVFPNQRTLTIKQQISGIDVIYSDTIPERHYVRDGKLEPIIFPSASEIPATINKIIIHRPAFGLGDVVTTLAAVQDLREKYPSAEIIYHIRESYSQILENHPAIDSIVYELPELSDTDYLVRFSNPCPATEYEKTSIPYTDKNRIDIFKESIKLHTDTMPSLYLTDVEKEWGKNFIDTNRIGLVLRTSERWRDFPSNKILIDRLKDYGIILIDHEINPFQIKDTRGKNIREIMSVINSLDVVITPDTAWLHVAGAFRKKIVALFGSMDTKQRSDPYGALSLSGDCPFERKPCWYDICVDTKEIPPCMSINIDNIVTSTKLLLG